MTSDGAGAGTAAGAGARRVPTRRRRAALLIAGVAALVGSVALNVVAQKAVAPFGFSFGFASSGPVSPPAFATEAIVTPLSVFALVVACLGAALVGVFVGSGRFAARRAATRVVAVAGGVGVVAGVLLVVWQVRHFFGGWRDLVTGASGQIGVQTVLHYPVVMSGGVFGPAMAGLTLGLLGIALSAIAATALQRQRSSRDVA